jgi:hypothetical protein
MSDANTSPPQKKVAPPPSRQPTAAKPKRGGFFRFFIVVLLLGGGGYYASVNGFPPWEAWQLSSHTPDKSTNLLADVPEQLSVLEQTSNVIAVDVTDMHNILTELRNEIVLLKQQQVVLQSRLAELSSAQASAFPIDIRLQLIDIQLRQSGDTAAAAAALLQLQDDEGIDVHWLSGEVRRLQETPNRKKIITIINDLAEKNATHYRQTDLDPEVTESGFLADVQAMFKNTFNLRRVENNGNLTAPHIDEFAVRQQLARLEILLIGSQRAPYQQALNSLVAEWNLPVDADRNIAVQLQLLQKFGAPMYYLNL